MIGAVWLLAMMPQFYGAECYKPETQAKMTECAGLRFHDADVELNRRYKGVMTVLSSRDAEPVRRAQRAWITFRDAHCASVGNTARGGSLEPMLVLDCKATLTRSRSEQLRQLVKGE